MAGPAGFASLDSNPQTKNALWRRETKMAGPAGFEPANAGTKTQCLTAWRRSNLNQLYHTMHSFPIVKSKLFVLCTRFEGH